METRGRLLRPQSLLTVKLSLPNSEDTQGGDNQKAASFAACKKPFNKRRHLDGFTQTHVVGQAAPRHGRPSVPCLASMERPQPRDALDLVRIETGSDGTRKTVPAG